MIASGQFCAMHVSFHELTHIFFFFFRQIIYKKSKKGKGRCYRTQNWILTRINSHISRAGGTEGAEGVIAYLAPQLSVKSEAEPVLDLVLPCHPLPHPPQIFRPSAGSHITYIQLTYIVVIRNYICIFWQIKRIIHPDWDTKASCLVLAQLWSFSLVVLTEKYKLVS